MRTFALAILAYCSAPLLLAEAAGDWVGALTLPQGRLYLVVHITGADDALSAVTDSPSQYMFGLPVDIIVKRGDSLSFTMQNLGVQFSGTVAGDQIQGRFLQNGNDLALVLDRTHTGNECTLGDAKLIRLSAAEDARAQPYYFSLRGLVFDEAGCISVAEQSFQRASAALEAAPSTSNNRFALTDTRAMLDLERARELVKEQHANQAIPVLWNVVRNLRTNNAWPRATELLASILPAKDPDWPELVDYIGQESTGNPPFMQANTALFLLRRHDFQADPASAIAKLEQEADTTEDLQYRFALQILLIEFYAKSGHPRNAELLLNSIEEDAGENLIDWSMRRNFLEIGASVWSAKARADSSSAARASAYSRLLQDFTARMARYF